VYSGDRDRRRSELPLTGRVDRLGGIGASLADLVSIGLRLPEVEWRRLNEGPGRAVAKLRARGHSARRRAGDDRQRLRRLIAIVDRFWPGEPNCYRRALLEMSLDAGAAEEQLHLGLKVPGGPRSGHAWLGTSAALPVAYDVQVDI
jgi:hypothetical protein